jgi:hypothetical protein
VTRTAAARIRSVVVEVGNLPIRLWCDSPNFARLIEERYSGFLSSSSDAVGEFEIELAPPVIKFGHEDVRVTWDAGQWLIERADFQARWNPATARGSIQQAPSIYSLDSVLRIVHTLLLARRGGFLLHASSAIWNGRAFLFSGASGTGKTTIVRLAPPGARLLADDISYLARGEDTYYVFGTPFYYELSRPGENLKAQINALYVLAKGSKNKIEPIRGAAAVRGLLENVLFFARDPELVKLVFDSACEFVNCVPVHQLTFVPDTSVWELILSECG